MALIVQKFGGSSVANAERVFNVADIVTKTYAEGNSVVVVVSAQGDTTDDLIEKAQEINPQASKREMDMLLTAGEQISASCWLWRLKSWAIRSFRCWAGRRVSTQVRLMAALGLNGLFRTVLRKNWIRRIL